MQTLLAECINRMAPDRYRHAVVCLSGYTEYADIITRAGVELIDLEKPPGAALSTHVRLWRLLRTLRPSLVHTYNIGAIEYCVTALLAGVAHRVHAEHGLDSVELLGKHTRYRRLRRILAPLVGRWVAVSVDLADWLNQTVGIARRRIACIPGGVDVARYAPAAVPVARDARTIRIGTVGRIDRIKNHALLLAAFGQVRARVGTELDLHLSIIGAGPLLAQLREQVRTHGWGDCVSLPGARPDVAELMREFDLFVLPSLSEGTPVTILEAMATGLPVLATRVGGVPQIVLEGTCGLLVEPDDLDALVDAMVRYVNDAALRHQHGAAGRARVAQTSGIDTMVAHYTAVYDDLHRRGRTSAPPAEHY